MTGPVEYHQIAFEKGNASTFYCHICTRSHGYTHVSRCQRRGIIHTVSGHRNHMARRFQSGYHCFFAIRQNLFFAFIYNALGVPVAAGLLYPVYGILLSPVIAAAAMALSSVSVIANALRLKSVRLGK